MAPRIPHNALGRLCLFLGFTSVVQAEITASHDLITGHQCLNMNVGVSKYFQHAAAPMS